jgi:hypothetical protein
VGDCSRVQTTNTLENLEKFCVNNLLGYNTYTIRIWRTNADSDKSLDCLETKNFLNSRTVIVCSRNTLY